MENENLDILIIGAGLTGLTLAYYLKGQPLKVKIIEARDRLGGRILTSYQSEAAPIEHGATWLGRKHEALNALLKELGIDIFRQELGETAVYEPISTSPHQMVQLPPNNDPSFRIKGGTSKLIETLASHIKENQIVLNEVVQKIEAQEEHLEVYTSATQYQAKVVVSTLPPYLFYSNIEVRPELPASLTEVARHTHTWMGESIKVGLRFKTPFWQEQNLSGTIFSNVGPIPEMYDHSDVDQTVFALKGFFNGSYYSVSKEERLHLVLRQLRKYFGEEIDNYTAYEESVWRNEKYTFTNYESHILPHQNNGHPIYQNELFNGKLFIGGAETAAQFPGYMEGAVRSAQAIHQKIVKP